MSIIYSYPEQGVLNADDMLIGTSAEKVSGKQKNITRNFSIQQIADFINGGTGFIDPVATDFQIPVFNQSGTKITGSIMSQDIYPNGTGITISGSLATTGSISTPGNLTATGIITLGSNQNLISLNSQTRLNGPILDTTGTVGSLNQILLSDSTGVVRWQNYVAGLTYQGVWNANTNTPALTSGVGTNGHFYVVDVLGNTNLNGNNDWQVGDWALFSGVTGAGGFWDKIDNTQSLTGSGTANTITMWTAGQAIGDSLISQAGTVVSVDGDLKVKDTIQATTANTNLKLKGAGTGGIEIMSADGITDGKIQLNCSVNSHGVTLQSPAHGSTVSYTLILPTSFGGAGDVLTSQGTNPSQLVWTTPTTGTVTGAGTTGTIPIYTDGPNSVIGNSIMSYSGTVVSVNGDFSTQGLEVNKYLTDGAGSNGADGFVLTSATSGTDKVISWVDPTTIGDSYDLSTNAKVGTSVPLNLTSGSGTDNSIVNLTEGTGITLTPNAAGNEITIAGVAQGITGSGTVNKLPKFGTTTSLTDSLVSEVPASSSSSVTADNTFFVEPVPQFLIMSGIRRLRWLRNQDINAFPTLTFPPNTATGTGVFVLTGDIILDADSTDVITAGTYNVDVVVGVSGGVWNAIELYFSAADWLQPTGVTGNVSYANSGAVTSLVLTTAATLAEIEIAAKLDMTTHKIINVVNPTDAQDAATKAYVDTSVSGKVASVTGTNNRIAITGTAAAPIVNAVTGTVNSSSLTLATGQEIQTAIDSALAGAVTFKGTFDANLGSITGTSDFLYNPGANSNTVPIAIGDMYIVSTAGNFYGVTGLNVGDEVIAIAAASINSSAEAGWNAVPSAGAGVVSVLPSSTGLVSTGQPLVITPAGGTGSVTIESTAYAGTTNVGHVPAGGSAGKYLDGAAGSWITLPASGTGTVTGTGAATQVTFWDGTSNVNGDTAFNWDNTNKRLGIGTASPGKTLEVKSTGNTAIRISTDGDAGDQPEIQFYRSGSDYAVVKHKPGGGSASGLTLTNYRSTDSNIIFNTAGENERMRIDSLGNVGIGTTSPESILHVKKLISTILVQDINTGFATTEAYIKFSGTTSSGGFRSDIAKSIGIKDNSLVFENVSVETMRITSVGQVKFNNYTAANSFTGTAVASLAVDSSGNIITEAAGGGGASTITTNNSSGNGTVGPFALGATPSGGSTSFVDVFIDGVYQEIATYTVSGTALSFVVGSEPPTGTNIQTKTTSGTVSGALVSSVDIGQSSGDTGAVNLRINPIEVTSGTTPTGAANSLYIFTSTTGSISTLTLPASPTAGDSIKISNIGGLANVIATSGTDKIMGQTGPMTINVTNAAFELIWSNIAVQGWIIIGNV